MVSGGSLHPHPHRLSYLPGAGRPSTVGTFDIEEPNNGIASVKVLAGGEYNGFDIYSLPNNATTLVGGPGYDTFSRHESPLGFSTGSLTLIGNGGGDTFFYDDSPLHDTSNDEGVLDHNLNYALTFNTMTSGTLHVADHNTGYDIDQNDFNAIVPFDWTPSETVAFSGMGEVWVQGRAGQEYLRGDGEHRGGPHPRDRLRGGLRHGLGLRLNLATREPEHHRQRPEPCRPQRVARLPGGDRPVRYADARRQPVEDRPPLRARPQVVHPGQRPLLGRDPRPVHRGRPG